MKRIIWLALLFTVIPATVLAETNEIPDSSWFTLAIVGLPFLLILSSGNKGKKKKSQMTRVGIIDNWLFDKGMTYNNGHEYEKYVAWWLGTKGYRNIQITPKSGDYGADIICYGRRGEKYAVQCKYYSKPVGYRAVEEVLGAMHYYGCNEAMVVTNSTYTKQALTAANRSGVKLIERVR